MGNDRVVFYEDKHGYSELRDLLFGKSSTQPKDIRVIERYIELLARYGHKQPNNIVKKLKNSEIWELRPNRYRVLFFTIENNKYVLLSAFMKKSNETPIREIEKAERLRKDWQKRNSNKQE